MRMIMNEKLLTHKPTHCFLRDEGINSVMGLKKKKQQHGENKHYFLPFQEFFTQKCDQFVNVSGVFLPSQGDIEDNGSWPV